MKQCNIAQPFSYFNASMCSVVHINNIKVNIYRRAQRFIFVGTPSHPASLLHGLEDDLLDPDIDEELLQGLLKASKKGTKPSFRGNITQCVFQSRTFPSFSHFLGFLLLFPFALGSNSYFFQPF